MIKGYNPETVTRKVPVSLSLEKSSDGICLEAWETKGKGFFCVYIESKHALEMAERIKQLVENPSD